MSNVCWQCCKRPPDPGCFLHLSFGRVPVCQWCFLGIEPPQKPKPAKSTKEAKGG